jgi:hypothetical protein
MDAVELSRVWSCLQSIDAAHRPLMLIEHGSTDNTDTDGCRTSEGDCWVSFWVTQNRDKTMIAVELR